MVKKMTPDEQRLLSAWVEELVGTFGLANVEVPLEELLVLSGAVSTGVARPAVPVTAYVAGYLAAIRAQGSLTTAAEAARTVQDITAVVPAPTTGR